jgi:threonine dehydratase
MEARRQGKVKDLPFISPYNDLEIVAGQGTIGVEIVEQFKKFEPDQGNFAFNVKKKRNRMIAARV